jgi:hypothetical protein
MVSFSSQPSTAPGRDAAKLSTGRFGRPHAPVVLARPQRLLRRQSVTIVTSAGIGGIGGSVAWVSNRFGTRQH